MFPALGKHVETVSLRRLPSIFIDSSYPLQSRIQLQYSAPPNELNSFRNRFDVDLQWAKSLIKKITRAGPVPVLRLFTQPTMHRIVMNVIDRFPNLADVPKIAIVAAAPLPKTIRFSPLGLAVQEDREKTGLRFPNERHRVSRHRQLDRR